MLLVSLFLRSLLPGGFFLHGGSRLGFCRDEQDAAFLESRFLEAGIGLVQFFLRYAIGLGDAEERLALHHQVGIIHFTIEFHLLRGDGDGGGGIVLGQGCGGAKQQEGGGKGDVNFHSTCL